MHVMEKTSVLAKLKQGDETSFTFVYDHYWRKVYRFSEIYLNDDEEIKEAVQEVFIKLWESRASINENKDIDGLLFIMTRNTIFDYFRKSLNKITMKITALEVAEKIAISDETLEVKDLLEYIWKLVSLLPPRQQEVFIMSRKQQMTNKEIAEQYGYFWAVTEAKVIEGSAVVFGSNYITPTLSVKQHVPNDTQKNEPLITEEVSIDMLKTELKTLFKN